MRHGRLRRSNGWRIVTRRATERAWHVLVVRDGMGVPTTTLLASMCCDAVQYVCTRKRRNVSQEDILWPTLSRKLTRVPTTRFC